MVLCRVFGRGFVARGCAKGFCRGFVGRGCVHGVFAHKGFLHEVMRARVGAFC